jgi:hypothetical protein
LIRCFPDPYPDEILYSICARYGDRVKYPGQCSILRELFGVRHANMSLDFPCRLGYFLV